ncbi:hypothetical protein BJX64DRAFT_269300 [Aspergillus heterothallicus]
MASAALRVRIQTLWTSLTDPRMDQCLQGDNIVPPKFLTGHNIMLTSRYSFSSSNTATGNLAKKPPLLFLLRPSRIITDHHIDPNGEFFRVQAEAGARPEDSSPATNIAKIFNIESSSYYH